MFIAPNTHRAIGDFSRVWQQIAEPESGLPVLPELEHRRHDGQAILMRNHSGDSLAGKNGRWNVLIEAACHGRFIVEQVEV